MNWVQFKDPVYHMCLTGTLVACWSLTQYVAGFQGFEPLYCIDKYSITEFSEFSENIKEKLH